MLISAGDGKKPIVCSIDAWHLKVKRGGERGRAEEESGDWHLTVTLSIVSATFAVRLLE